MADVFELRRSTKTRMGDTVDGPPDAQAGHSSLSLRNLAAVYAPIALLLLPFAFHRSAHPDLLGYSWDYVVFLGALVAGSIAFAGGLLWLVRNAPPKRRVPFALVLLGLMLACLMAIELFLGYLNRDAFADFRQWGNRRSPFVGFELAPDNRWRRDDDYGRPVVYTTDAGCFRIHTGRRLPREQETLIVVMGGSSAFGYGLNDDETWPCLLEHKLRRRFGDSVTVLNAANSGHTSLQQLFRFYLRVLPLKPDCVLYYGAVNDTRRNSQIDPLTGQAPILMDSDLLEATTTRQYLRRKNHGKCFYFASSLLINHLKGLYENWASSASRISLQRWMRQGKAEEFNEGVAAFLRNLDYLHLLCKANDIEFVPITLISNGGDQAKSGLNYYIRALRAHYREQGTPLIDLYPAFDGVENKRDLFFKDRYHPTVEGARFIAEEVFNSVVPLVAKRLRRS